MKQNAKGTEMRLLTPFGKIILSIPDDMGEQFWNEFMTAWESQVVWNVGNWPDVKASYLNERAEYIDFNKVVASW